MKKIYFHRFCSSLRLNSLSENSHGKSFFSSKNWFKDNKALFYSGIWELFVIVWNVNNLAWQPANAKRGRRFYCAGSFAHVLVAQRKRSKDVGRGYQRFLARFLSYFSMRSLLFLKWNLLRIFVVNTAVSCLQFSARRCKYRQEEGIVREPQAFEIEIRTW